MNKKRGIRGYYKEDIDLDVYFDPTLSVNEDSMFDEDWEKGILG